MERTMIEIYEDGVWAGQGWLRDGYVEDCPAVLGGDQDTAESIYDQIEQAISEEEDHVVCAGHRYSWSVVQPPVSDVLAECDRAAAGQPSQAEVESGLVLAPDIAKALTEAIRAITPKGA